MATFDETLLEPAGFDEALLEPVAGSGEYSYLQPLPPITAAQLGDDDEYVSHPALPLPLPGLSPRPEPLAALPPSVPYVGPPPDMAVPEDSPPQVGEASYLPPLPSITAAKLAEPQPSPGLFERFNRFFEPHYPPSTEVPTALSPSDQAILDEELNRMALRQRLQRVQAPLSEGSRESAVGGVQSVASPAGLATLGAITVAPEVALPALFASTLTQVPEVVSEIQRARESGDRAAYYKAVGDAAQTGAVLLLAGRDILRRGRAMESAVDEARFAEAKLTGPRNWRTVPPERLLPLTTEALREEPPPTAPLPPVEPASKPPPAPSAAPGASQPGALAAPQPEGGPIAGKIQGAATLYGDVRSQPVESERQMPLALGGPGVQPQAEGAAAGVRGGEPPQAPPEVPLTPTTAEPVTPVEAPKPPEPAIADVSQFLQVEVPDAGSARATRRSDFQQAAELEGRARRLDDRILALRQRVTYSTGPRYRRGQIKPSARRADVDEYQRLRKEQDALRQVASQLSNASAPEAIATELEALAKRVNREDLAVLQRLEARAEMFRVQRQNVPGTLAVAIETEAAKIAREHFPDANAAELKRLATAVRRSYMSTGSLESSLQMDPELNLTLQRQNELRSAVQRQLEQGGLLEANMDEGLKREIASHTALFGGTSAGAKPLTRAKLDELIIRVNVEGPAVRERLVREKAAAEKAAREMEAKFTRTFRTESASDAVAAKRILVRELEAELRRLAEDANLRVEKMPDRDVWGFYTPEGAEQGWSRWENGVMIVRSPAGEQWPVKAASVEEGLRLARQYLSCTPGKTTIAIPGDGSFKLVRNGAALNEMLARARRLETTTGGLRRYTQSTPSREFSRQALREAEELARRERGTEESRVRPSGGSPASIFEMADEDLADYLDERFGAAPRPSGGGIEPARRPSPYGFSTYDDFRDWMDARYAERDLEGMKLAFAEAPTPNKVAYIKGNRSPGHKSDWISHMATGSPLPSVDPPVVRSTPRPMPGGGFAPAPGAPAPAPPGSGTPQPPLPPPRAPSLHPRFDVTALVQLYRRFGKFPVMNMRLRSALGRMVTGRELVELKQRLFWDNDLAERVLGHEIGHFIDLIVPLIGKGKQFGQRLRLLTDFTRRAWESRQLRADVKSLSRQWRGPFPNGDPYRDTAKELIADFLSAMFHDPEWVNQQYPRLYDSFAEFRAAKPGFDSAYREIEAWLQGRTVIDELLKQDREAVKRTFDELAKQEPKRPLGERAKLMGDRMTQALVSLWGRAFQKEGRPRRIGESITEKLETSYMWASKKAALWADRYTREVQPHIDRLVDSPEEAHTYLTAYTKAVRTIGERRAAGLWLEQHPIEARDLLQGVLDLDSTLKGKWQGALDAVAQGGNLYDLSAAIIRDIHDRGDAFVRRMRREIDDLNLGVGGEAALMAFNVRGKLLNPGGQTVPNSFRMIAELGNRLGPGRFAELEAAARGLRGLLHNVQREMLDAGLIARSTWDELIEPNVEYYVPYAVLDYFEGRVRAGVMPQVGTAKDVADTAVATQLKVAAMYGWLQRQRQVQLLRDVYAAGPEGAVPVGERLRRAGDIDRIRVRGNNAKDDVSRVVLWVDGQPHLVEFPNDYRKQFEVALELPGFYQHIEWLHDLSNFAHKVMQVFTKFSPRFLLYRNIVRGFRTAGLKVGYLRAARQMSPENFRRNLALARNYASFAIEGTPLLPEVREMIDREALPPPQMAVGAVRDLPNMRELIKQGVMPAFLARRAGANLPATPQGPLRRGVGDVNREFNRILSAYEAFEKIYNYQAALEAGHAPETAAAVAARGGIPRPGVSGKWSSAAEVLFPWTRVRTQGMRASYQMLRDPRFGRAFGARFAFFEVLPRLAKIAVGLGLAAKAISWFMRRDEDKDDPVWGEIMRRVSPYKMALDDVVPFALYDPRTGAYHPFWEFKSGSAIPQHYEVVSLRLPASEEGQTFANALYAELVTLPGVHGKLGRPGAGLLSALGDAYNAMGPQLNPAVTTTAQLLKMIVSGRNPEDPRTGSPAANKQLFDAGGVDRAQAIAGYILNQAGGPGEAAAVLAANLGLLDERALGALSRRLAADKRPWTEKFPFLQTAVSHDNYAAYRTEKEASLAEAELRAKARILMPPEVYRLYEFYYRNEARQAKLDPQDRVRFEIARMFVSDVWGDATKLGDKFYPARERGGFNSAAMNAMNGSRQARATLKRDLLNATEMLRAAWDAAR